MINYIKGNIVAIEQQNLTIITNNIGYSIYTPKPESFSLQQPIELYIYMHWNSDNGPSLYGFETTLEKTIFTLLLGCPKVGPKVTMNILQQITPTELLDIVSQQDEKRLSSVNGIGEKTAENIILQLKRKVSKLIESGIIKPTESSRLSHYNTLSDALLSLGYTKQEISNTIKQLSKEGDLSLDQLMRRAFLLLSRNG